VNERHHHAVYVISVFAELAGVHPQTLRNYERSGLLNPKRTSGGSRRFSEADLEAIRRIQELTTDGVNLQVSAVAARFNVEETHRHYRRDLVPVRNSIAVFIERFSRHEGES
jgi:MerR family transcriptional regulator/heat shock protein HspR